MTEHNMREELTRRLQKAPIVPLVQADNPTVAVATAKALVAGGLSVIEVLLRTDAALTCLSEIAEKVPGAIVGAGTVLTAEQARVALRSGAKFIVSPGLNAEVVKVARASGVPVFPGIATATELQMAWNLGLDVVKFFPAGLAGGTAMLNALGAVFRNVKFMPTGGISAQNLAEYLALPAVIACGGSWLTPAAVIARGDYTEVSRLAEESLIIAGTARGAQ
ncbi:MAG: bifunctional 4-hydroxy-2-oxoglutarate aldolase/2-dehydro-3-deoxy-phosphogluconate aldolase [Lysobacterales bacterium]